MRLAFLTSIIPDGKPKSGYEIANEAIVAGLRQLGHGVLVIGFKLPRQGPVDDKSVIVLDERDLENATAGAAKKLGWLHWALIRNLPFAAAKLASFRTSDLDQVLGYYGPFDAHILNSYQMPAAFPQLAETRYCYVAHNVEFRSAIQNIQSAKSSFERLMYQRDARLLKSLERELCDRSRYVWTFSDDDLVEHIVEEAKGCVLPLVVPHETEPGEPKEKQYDIGLIGTWSWQPNLVGLKWFIEEVLPLLPDSLTVAVAGVVPADMSLNHKQVKYLGRVDSAGEFLNSVQVVPLVSRGGTGVQLKTIETFQAGHACVATKSSLRGVNTIPENCMPADQPEEFAAALCDLVQRGRTGTLPKSSGSDFHDKQLRALLAGLEQGIDKLG